MQVPIKATFLAIFNRKQFWGILAGLSLVYELGNVIIGETVIGFLTIPVFYAFALRSGFFKTRGNAKRFIMILFFLAALATQYRFGLSFLYKSFIRIFATLFLCFLRFLFFLPEVQKHLDAENAGEAGSRGPPPEQPPVIRLSPDKFTRRDVDMLNKVLGGQKYAAIAREYGLAESTLKNRLRLLFNKIGVSDRVSFLSGYACHVLALEGEETLGRSKLPAA